MFLAVQIAELRIICMEIKVGNAFAFNEIKVGNAFVFNVQREMPIVRFRRRLPVLRHFFPLLERQIGCCLCRAKSCDPGY